MEALPWNELISGLVGLIVALVAQWFGLKLPKKEPPAAVSPEPDPTPDPAGPFPPALPLDPSLPREPLALRRRAEEVAEKAGLDPRKIKVLDLTTLTLILTLLSRYGPVVLEMVRGIVDAIWARQRPAPAEPPVAPSPVPDVTNTDS